MIDSRVGDLGIERLRRLIEGQVEQLLPCVGGRVGVIRARRESDEDGKGRSKAAPAPLHAPPPPGAAADLGPGSTKASLGRSGLSSTSRNVSSTSVFDTGKWSATA